MKETITSHTGGYKRILEGEKVLSIEVNNEIVITAIFVPNLNSMKFYLFGDKEEATEINIKLSEFNFTYNNEHESFLFENKTIEAKGLRKTDLIPHETTP
jgi:hypothetical protein